MITAAIIIYILWNTIWWMKGNEPYHFGVHFLYVFYMFSNESRFSKWYKRTKSIIHENLFTEYYYISNYIKKILWDNYKSEFKRYGVYNIECRKKEGWKVYIHLYSDYEWSIMDMEVFLFQEIKEKVEIIFIHYKFVK